MSENTPLNKNEKEFIINSVYELKQKADLQTKECQYQSAKNIYNEVISKIITLNQPQSIEVLDSLHKEILLPSYLNLAFIDIKQQNWESLIFNSAKAIEIDSENSKAIYRRCLGYIKIQNYEKAEQDFGKLKQLIPNNTELKMLKEMLENKNETNLKSQNEMYKKMFRNLSQINKSIEYEKKSACGKRWMDFSGKCKEIYNKILCCGKSKNKNKKKKI